MCVGDGVNRTRNVVSVEAGCLNVFTKEVFLSNETNFSIMSFLTPRRSGFDTF